MTVKQRCLSELNKLWRSPWQLAMVSYIPLISMLCLWWLFSAGLPRQLPVAVVDLDNSQVSRMLTRNLQANAVISPQSYANLATAEADMRQAKVYALVVFPVGMNKDLVTANKPLIDIRYNSQFLLVGKLLSSQIQLSLGNGLLTLGAKKLLLSGTHSESLAVSLSPVTSQTTALFNRNNNYVGFLVPPVLIALWQILSVFVFMNSLNAELKPAEGQPKLAADFWKTVIAKVLLLTPIMLIHGSFILVWLYLYLALPIAGSIGLLIIAQLVMLLTLWLIACLIFLIIREKASCISICTALFAPAFAFMGITFPVNEMPLIAQWWRLIMPSSHYIDSHVGIVSYGETLPQLLAQLGSYWIFLPLIPIIFILSHFALERRPIEKEGSQ
ncbi:MULTISPECIES: ABC transporter permease [Shewanella]|uniref:ABC transporter permease n=1 Tax=Shewanella holmiensis TaxID=2952222 RepID=A0A9X2WNK6_9GAMM|nr:MULTISPECIES: ABC transporter permease [Shewanella]MCT7942643.1 ABC transporter permease [Shewanella holmiensis]MDP5147686.1 ABC transporter permease [Shewanella sp. ULN5]